MLLETINAQGEFTLGIFLKMYRRWLAHCVGLLYLYCYICLSSTTYLFLQIEFDWPVGIAFSYSTNTGNCEAPEPFMSLVQLPRLN